MAALFKERARKPVIDFTGGVSCPVTKYENSTLFYGVEIREPWQQDGKYQIYSLYLTRKEMLAVMREWMATLAREDRP